MTLKVDTKKINENIVELDKEIKNYSDNSYNIFFELSKLDSYWKGDNKNSFDDKIVKEKANNLVILDELEKMSNFYKNVQNLYDKYKNNGE